MESISRTGWERILVAALVLALALLASAGAGSASAGWLPPADLAPANPNGSPTGAPSIGMGRDGTAIVAFVHFDGAVNRVGVAVRGPGSGFSAVQDVSAPGQPASSPALAMDRQGNATVAFAQGPGGAVVTRYRPAGGDWGPVSPALSAGAPSRGPAIAVGDDGAAVVGWGRFDAGFERVEAAVRPRAGQPFGPALPVSPNGVNSLCEPPKVAMDAAGNVVALWTRRTSNGGDYHVESAVKAAGASQFAGFETRSIPPGNSPCNIDLRMAPDGRATAIWDYSDLGNATVRYVAYADRSAPFATGAWSAGQATLATDSGQPLIAIDDAGNSGVIWVSGGQIVSAVRTGLGGFSPLRPLSGATDSAGRRLKAVEAGPNGDAITTFVSTSNNLEAVFAARRQAGGEFGGVTPLSAAPPGGATIRFDGPDVALDDQGNAFAVWQRSVSGVGTTTAQVAAFDPVPPVLTDASVPASGRAREAVAMTAAASDRMASPALRFDFGDGSGATGGSVRHVYDEAGTFTVTITATDAAGNATSTTRQIQVAPAPPTGPSGGPSPGPGGGGSKIILATVSMRWNRLSNGRTELIRLIVSGLAGPESVKLGCNGKGCRKKAKRTIAKHGKQLKLTKFIKGMRLRPKARLTIAMTRPGYTGRTVTYTMVKNRDPKKSIRCRAPGAKKTTRC